MRKWGEFTDFYSSEHHARNVGKMFRDPENALLPNWKHLPVAYHGRSSSIIASGEPVYRPSGQRKEADGSITFGPTRKLDFELEVGVVIGRDSERGKPIAMAEADSYIEGLVLVNDWSARDIQAWEYVPLGPFLGKNFATTVGDTVVPLADLEPFRIEGPVKTPRPCPICSASAPPISTSPWKPGWRLLMAAAHCSPAPTTSTCTGTSANSSFTTPPMAARACRRHPRQRHHQRPRPLELGLYARIVVEWQLSPSHWKTAIQELHRRWRQPHPQRMGGLG